MSDRVLSTMGRCCRNIQRVWSYRVLHQEYNQPRQGQCRRSQHWLSLWLLHLVDAASWLQHASSSRHYWRALNPGAEPRTWIF